MKNYEINKDEELFFNKLFDEVGDGIRLQRMSDGSISVSYYTYPIGKIKLQGRKHKMQILKGYHGVKWIEGNINDFISHIPDWKKYIEWVVK